MIYKRRGRSLLLAINFGCCSVTVRLVLSSHKKGLPCYRLLWGLCPRTLNFVGAAAPLPPLPPLRFRRLWDYCSWSHNATILCSSSSVLYAGDACHPNSTVAEKVNHFSLLSFYFLLSVFAFCFSLLSFRFTLPASRFAFRFLRLASRFLLLASRFLRLASRFSLLTFSFSLLASYF